MPNLPKCIPEGVLEGGLVRYQVPLTFAKIRKNGEIGKCFPDCFYGKGQSLCAFLGVLTNNFCILTSK